MLTREEAAQVRLRTRKAKALRQLRNVLAHLDAMILEARGLEATTSPGLRQGPYGSGAQYPDTGESGEAYDAEMRSMKGETTR